MAPSMSPTCNLSGKENNSFFASNNSREKMLHQLHGRVYLAKKRLGIFRLGLPSTRQGAQSTGLAY